MKKDNSAITIKTVDDYLRALPERVRVALEKLRQTILAAAPKAEEIISYKIPTYKYHGALVHFAAFEEHCSFFVVNKNILKTFNKELQSYKTSGTTIHFTPEVPLPASLVKKIVSIRIKENEDRIAQGKTKSGSVNSKKIKTK